MQHISSNHYYKLHLGSIIGTIIIAVLLGAVSNSSIVAHAHVADGKPIFGVQPVHYDPNQPVTKAYFVFDTHLGTVLDNSVRVTHNGTATGTVSLYAVDATTGQTSGTVYLSPNDA